MRLDLTDLRVFLQTCDSGSMTVAARRLHLTLAAVSARIKALEEGTGVLLLQRHARGASPTAAGEVLARHARIVFHQVEALRQEMAPGAAADGGTFLILGNSSALARPLGRLAARLLEQFPATRLVVRESASEATVQALHAGAADIGIVSDSVSTHGLQAVPLGPDPLLLVAPASQGSAAGVTARFQDFLAQEWIVWGEGSALHTHLQMQAWCAGSALRCKAAVPSVDAVLELVGRGAGVAVLPAALVARSPLQAQVRALELADAWARRRLLAVRRTDAAGPVASAMWQALQDDWPGA